MVCKLARIAVSSGDETWPFPLLEPLPSAFASTSGGGIVALAFEADDLGLLLFMLFSKFRNWLRPAHRHSYDRARYLRISLVQELRRILGRRNQRQF
jgi:hypothetical protein